MNIIEINNLTKKVKKNTIYKDINLTVQKGDCYALIGADNEGKTSILHTLLGFSNATSGSFSIMGENPLSKKSWKKVSYVPDDLLCFPQMTGAGLLDMTISLKNITDAYDYATELIEYFEVNPSLLLYEMEDDMNKCTYLISALLSRPELLILDEPFNFLSDKTTEKLRQFLFTYCQKGNTVLITSDHYDNVQNICSRFSVLKDGIQIHTDESSDQYAVQKLIISRTEAKQPLPDEFVSQIHILKPSSDRYRYLFTGDIRCLNRLLGILDLPDYVIQDITIDDQILNKYEWMEDQA